MTSAKRRRERHHAKRLQRGKTCSGCGSQAISLGGEWLLPHDEDCSTLATDTDRSGRELLDVDVEEGLR